MPKTAERGDDDIWGLVDYDPICVALSRMKDTIIECYPAPIGSLAVELTDMVLNETYDRLEGRGRGMRRMSNPRSRAVSRHGAPTPDVVRLSARTGTGEAS